MELWEYQVIHLNVEGPAGAAASPPAGAPPAAPPRQESAPASPPSPRPEAVFSKEYLEKEFPDFYGPAQAPGAAAQSQDHPAHQLRNFLNQQGRQGWQLVGFYPVGQLQMMIFRRPRRPAPPAVELKAALVTPASPAAAVAGGEAAVQGDVAAANHPEQSTAAEAAPPQAGVAASAPEQPQLVERLLERLEALERRLAAAALPPPATAADAQSPSAAGANTPVANIPLAQAAPLPLAELEEGAVLSESRLHALAGHPRLSTAEAAAALGFRSPASLLNRAARSGYALGLIKRGGNERVAIYVGSERNGRGGRDRRLWVVIPAPPSP